MTGFVAGSVMKMKDKEESWMILRVWAGIIKYREVPFTEMDNVQMKNTRKRKVCAMKSGTLLRP